MSLVNVEIADRVATLTLNDPEGRNRLTLPMVTEISAAMDAIDADPEVGAVVVTGAGKAFCAGADLGDLARSTGESLKVIYEGFLRIGSSPLPTLAAVNGPAVGAGLNLALVCDVRVASTRARFDCRFPQLGIHPGGGHSWMLRRAIGPTAAAAMLLFGEIPDGEEAVRLGLAHRCVPEDQLLATAHDMAKRAADVPRPLSTLIKQTLKDMGQVTEHDSAVERELWPQVWTTRQPFFTERLAALQAQISSKS